MKEVLRCLVFKHSDLYTKNYKYIIHNRKYLLYTLTSNGNVCVPIIVLIYYKMMGNNVSPLLLCAVRTIELTTELT